MAPVHAHEPASQGQVGSDDAALRPAGLRAELLGQLPAPGAHVIGEPDRISELGLQHGHGAVDLDMFGVTVFAPGIMRVNIGAAGKRRAQCRDQFRVVGFVARAGRFIGDHNAGECGLRLGPIGGKSGAALGQLEVDKAG